MRLRSAGPLVFRALGIVAEASADLHALPPVLLPGEVDDERPVDLPGIPRYVLELQTRTQVPGQTGGTASAGADDGCRAVAKWKKRLVDTNVERLRDRDLAWADVVLLSAMHIQRDSLAAIVERCRARGLRTVVGGPIASSLSCGRLKADHVVIGEAESLIAGLAHDLEQGTAKPVYQAPERPEMTTSPLPDLSLIKMRRYSTMAVQYSRGCPFNCEFCDIIEIYGRRPRTKAVAQVLAELDQLRAAGWREAVFIVDDNFIGNKARAKELCVALAEWRSQYKTSFDFLTEASLNLADDPELMQLMKDAGFVSVFLGIETPDEPGLIASNKMQNTRRSLLDSVAMIQSYGMQVMGGFILGFDTDREDIFDRMVEFIQKSGIPIAMVGLLQAMPGTQLFRRLWRKAGFWTRVTATIPTTS